MANLMDIYEAMTKTAETEPTTPEADAAVTEQMEVLAKYAEAADGYLKEEYGEGKYTPEDVEKLAELLIDHDMQIEVQQEKVAEYIQAGQIMARSFNEELLKLAKESA